MIKDDDTHLSVTTATRQYKIFTGSRVSAYVREHKMRRAQRGKEAKSGRRRSTKPTTNTLLTNTTIFPHHPKSIMLLDKSALYHVFSMPTDDAEAAVVHPVAVVQCRLSKQQPPTRMTIRHPAAFGVRVERRIGNPKPLRQ